MELVGRSSTSCQEEICLWSFSGGGDLKMVTCFLFLFSSLSFISYHISHLFLCAFAKLQKEAVRFVMSVCLNGTSRLPLDRFS